MKRILMLNPMKCGSGDFKKSGIYDVKGERWLVLNSESEEYDIYEYITENVEKYPKGERWITIIDESKVEDIFQVYENEDSFILCENEKELAHELIERIHGLDAAIINMAMAFRI